jgi:hypothetical protein
MKMCFPELSEVCEAEAELSNAKLSKAKRTHGGLTT